MSIQGCMLKKAQQSMIFTIPVALLAILPWTTAACHSSEDAGPMEDPSQDAGTEASLNETGADASQDVANDQGDEGRFAALAQSIESERSLLGAPGAAVAVLEGGQVTWSKGFGSKRAHQSEPVLPTTLFRIGSMTKMMTATAMLQLVQSGQLDLQKSVPTYVPEFKFKEDASWAPSILLQHLLTHSSGMVDYLEIDWSDKSDNAIDYLTSSAFESKMYLMAPSGRFWNYSNPNFMVAGLIEQHVSGQAYPTLVRSKVWEPLGMTRTFFHAEDVTKDGDFAYGKTVNWNTGSGEIEAGPNEYDNPWARPAGYAWSSALDLAKFANFLLHGNDGVLSKNLLDELKRKQIDTDMYLDLIGYGYGMFVEESTFADTKFYKVKVLEHGGDIPGFAADMYLVPDRDFAMIVLANTDAAHMSKSFGVALETLAGVNSSTPPDPDVDTSQFAKYAGEYNDQFNVGTIILTTDQKDLYMQAPLLDKAGIGYTKKLTCYVRDNCETTITQNGKNYNVDVTFIFDQQGEVEYLRSRIFVAKRVSAVDGGTSDGAVVDGGDTGDAGLSMDSGANLVPPFHYGPDMASIAEKLRVSDETPMRRFRHVR